MRFLTVGKNSINTFRFDDFVELTFDHTNRTECRFDPSGADQPLLHIGHYGFQILRIGSQQPIEFDELAGTEEHSRYAEFEIFIVQFQ
jgi:hypothetical protein